MRAVILVLLLIIVMVLLFCPRNSIENFTDSEALQNIASLYNSNQLTATTIQTNSIGSPTGTLAISSAINVTGNITSPTITTIQSQLAPLLLTRSYASVSGAPQVDSNNIRYKIFWTPGTTWTNWQVIPSMVSTNFIASSDFTNTGHILQYTGATSKVFMIRATILFDNLANSYSSFALAIGAVTKLESSNGADQSDGSTSNLTLTLVTTLNKSDQINLYYVGRNVNIHGYNIIAHQLN
jgi:hypothetical protein